MNARYSLVITYSNSMPHGQHHMPVIVIAPHGVDVVVRAEPGAEILRFYSLRDIEHWNPELLDRTIVAPLKRVLQEIGVDPARFSPELRVVFARLAIRCEAPNLKLLIALSGIPERTFYRHWKRAIAESPHLLLARVRLRHAEEYLDLGMDIACATRAAGFATIPEFRRSLRLVAGKS